MRIITKEIRKLFRIKPAAILVIFTAVFIRLFLSIAGTGWNYVNSPSDVDFYRELAAQFGPELTTDEWDAFMAKRQSMIDEFNAAISQDKILQKNGIDTFDKCVEARSALVSGDGSYTNKDELSDEINRIIFYDSVTSPMYFKLQIMSEFVHFKGMTFWGSKTQDEIFKKDTVSSEQYKKRYTELVNSNSVSLIPSAVTRTVDNDFSRMVILSAVWCFIMILPYQIGERLKGVRELQISSKTGRSIFGKQAFACALTGLFTGGLLSAIYAVLLYRKGAFDFLDCVIIPNMRIIYWFDLTYRQYLLIYLAVFLISSVAAAILAYLVGRLSVNYIAGLGISIPTAAGLCAAVSKFGYMPFYAHAALIDSFVKILLTVGLCAVCSAAAAVMLKKDKVRDIL